MCLRGDDDVDDLAATFRTELYSARGKREQCVVSTAADVDAGVKVGAALAHDDLACTDDLATEPLHAEALCV